MTPITNLKTLTGGIGHAKLVSRHMKFGWLILISSFPWALRTKLKQGVLLEKHLAEYLQFPNWQVTFDKFS